MTSTLVISALNETFRNRVHYYMKEAAIAVMAEAIATPGHTERLAYAALVLNGNASVAGYAIAVSTNSTIAAAMALAGGQDNVTDSDLEFTVNSMYSAFAGFATGT